MRRRRPGVAGVRSYALAHNIRYVGWVLGGVLLVASVVWILFVARGTSFGPAVDDPKDFLITLLNGVTAAGLYFVVASGFTLIFGLMRIVNMDVALTVAGYVTMMHDGQKVVEGTPAEIRANEMVHEIYLGSGFQEEAQ